MDGPELLNRVEAQLEEEAWGVRHPPDPTLLAAWLKKARQPRMFAEVLCDNWHDMIVEAAVYDPESQKSVWGSQVEYCFECDAPVTVGRYFVTNEVQLTDEKP